MDRNSSTLMSGWSPKTVGKDVLQYFESASERESNPILHPSQIHSVLPYKAEEEITSEDVNGIWQQVNRLNPFEQWLLTPPNGDMDNCIPQSQRLHPDLPSAVIENIFLTDAQQIQKEIILPDDTSNFKPVNNFHNLKDASVGQSNMGSQLFPSNEEYCSWNSTTPQQKRAAQEVSMVSSIQAFMLGEKDGFHVSEAQRISRSAAEMPRSMVGLHQFSCPTLATHSAPKMQVNEDPVPEFGAVPRELTARVLQQTFESDFSSRALRKLVPENAGSYKQYKPFSASFNPPNQNKISHGRNKLPVNQVLNQSSHRLMQKSEVQDHFRTPRVASVPLKAWQSVSDFGSQHLNNTQRGPQTTPDYYPTRSRPGQNQAQIQLEMSVDVDMQLEKNMMHMAGCVPESSYSNTMLPISGYKREITRGPGLNPKILDPQPPHFDQLGNMFIAGKTTQHLHSINPPSSLPRQTSNKETFILNQGAFSSNQGAFSSNPDAFSSNRGALSSNPDASSSSLDAFSSNQGAFSSNPDAWSSNLGAFSPNQRTFSTNQRAFSSKQGCFSPNQRDFNSKSSLTPESTSTRTMKNRGGQMSLLPYYLEECCEQLSCLENERKKTEVILSKAFPGKCISLATCSSPLPKLPPNHSGVDRLIVEQIREQAMVMSLLAKMEQLKMGPLHANIILALEQHHKAICVTQARRKEELLCSYSHQKQFGPRFRANKEILLLAGALKDLSATTRKSRTTLWCAVQTTVPISAGIIDY